MLAVLRIAWNSSEWLGSTTAVDDAHNDNRALYIQKKKKIEMIRDSEHNATAATSRRIKLAKHAYQTIGEPIKAGRVRVLMGVARCSHLSDCLR